MDTKCLLPIIDAVNFLECFIKERIFKLPIQNDVLLAFAWGDLRCKVRQLAYQDFQNDPQSAAWGFRVLTQFNLPEFVAYFKERVS